MQELAAAGLPGSNEKCPACQIRRSATASTAAGGCPLLRPAISSRFLDLAFDPDDGKDQHGSSALLQDAIHG